MISFLKSQNQRFETPPVKELIISRGGTESIILIKKIFLKKINSIILIQSSVIADSLVEGSSFITKARFLKLVC